MREKVIEEYLRLQVKQKGGKAYKFVSPGNAGVPDRIVILPGGIIFFAEMKAPGGRTTSLQNKKIEELKKLGCRVSVIDSREGVDQVLAACEEMREK